MEKVNWKVQGMSCTNCALTIDTFLRQKGMEDVKVNFIGGNVSFDMPDNHTSRSELAKGIEQLGYHVEGPAGGGHDHGHDHGAIRSRRIFRSHFQRFVFCGVFTLPLVLHMIPGLHIHFLMSPYVQLALTIPVFLTGMDFFGRSGWKSLTRGIPNMNVLVALGSLAAFCYSLYGTLTGQAEQFLFYETTATIITLVFLGNWLEDKSVETTQRELRKLTVSQKIMANMIAYDDQHQEHVFPVESTHLKVGDLLLIKSGEVVPADCKILWGELSVSEAIITGESVPVEKKMNDRLIGGSTVTDGTVKAYVTAAGDNTVMAGIVKMVQDAQAEKPPVQQLADKISAIFVPVVIGIALLTLLLNYFAASQSFTESLLRSIAVLVIACPCAMGLATPAAIAVGLGRAARHGVLFRNARSLEIFRHIRQVVFDKTGTLTTGDFRVKAFHLSAGTSLKQGDANGTGDEEEFRTIVYSLEKYSNHPIGKAIAREWKTKNEIRWAKITEVKGSGMTASDREGNQYLAVSYTGAAQLTRDDTHNVYVIRNNQLIGWIDVADEIRPEAKEVIQSLRARGMRTILLSGDQQKKCDQVAAELGIDVVMAEQTPQQKLDKIAQLDSQSPVAMVGDGINDAPALAKATVGISLSDASHIAMQSAQVVLMNHGLKNLPLALGLGRHTYLTIQQNLFWAFIYNIVAIPVAAFGLLSPTFGALVMGLSDVVLAVNSVRLAVKKVL